MQKLAATNSEQAQVLAFKADNKKKKKQQVYYNPQTGMPMPADSFERINAEQKKDKRKQNIITGIAIGASAIAAVYFGRALIKDIKLDRVAKKAAESGDPTGSQQELGIKTREELMTLFSDVKNAKSFDELKMSPELRKALDDIVDKIQNAATYDEYMQEVNNAILFYGPPGTGKTTFVKALCKKLNVKPYIYDMGFLKGGFQGTTEANMRNASETFLAHHRAMRAKDPKHISIIFFDECDEVFQKATGPNKDSDSQILTRFKRCFDTWKEEKGVYIFGCTNKTPAELDDAIANRMKKNYIPAPSWEALSENFFNHYAKGGAKIAGSLKNRTEKSDKFFQFLENKGIDFSYRDLGRIGWQDGTIADKTKPLTFNDIIDRALKDTELHLEDSEVRYLKSLKS